VRRIPGARDRSRRKTFSISFSLATVELIRTFPAAMLVGFSVIRPSFQIDTETQGATRLFLELGVEPTANCPHRLLA
jgi:hypothetical protein